MVFLTALDEPLEGLQGKDAIKAMYDLIVAALQTDSTRVMTYRMPGQTLLDSIGVSLSCHNVSHYPDFPKCNQHFLCQYSFGVVTPHMLTIVCNLR